MIGRHPMGLPGAGLRLLLNAGQRQAFGLRVGDYVPHLGATVEAVRHIPTGDKHAPRRILTTRERKAWLTERG